MPKQAQRLTWRLAKKDRRTEARARELWLHRPGEEPVHVGGTYYEWSKSERREYWSWYSTRAPWPAPWHREERFYSTERYPEPEEAAERLRTRPHIQQWPKQHCPFCTAIGCTKLATSIPSLR